MACLIPALAGWGSAGWPLRFFGAAESGGEPASCSHTVAICAHMAGSLVSGGQARSGWASSRNRSRVDPDRPAQTTNTGSALGSAASCWTVRAIAGPGLGGCPRRSFPCGTAGLRSPGCVPSRSAGRVPSRSARGRRTSHVPPRPRPVRGSAPLSFAGRKTRIRPGLLPAAPRGSGTPAPGATVRMTGHGRGPFVGRTAQGSAASSRPDTSRAAGCPPSIPGKRMT
jgi:hypothetical protein